MNLLYEELPAVYEYGGKHALSFAALRVKENSPDFTIPFCMGMIFDFIEFYLR